MKVNAITPQIHKMAKKGTAIAAGIAIGLAAGSIYHNSKVNANQNTQVEYTLKSGDSYRFSTTQKGHEFNSLNDIKQQGKTKHLFAAQDGPDKGSRYYRSSDYNFFGYYKK